MFRITNRGRRQGIDSQTELKHGTSRRLFILLLILQSVFPLIVSAAPALMLEPDQNERPLGQYIEILEDKNKSLSIDQVSSIGFNQRFTSGDTPILNLGYTNSAYWARFKLRNYSDEVSWILEYGKPHMDKIEFYIPLDGGGFAVKKTGDLLPFAEREFPYHNFAFPLKIALQNERIYYMRFETKGTMAIPLKLWTEKSFNQAVYKEQLLLGLYYGLIGVMILYNLFIFLALRDRSYLYYVCYITCLAFAISVSNGISFEYLWPNFPWWQNQAMKIFFSLANFWLIMFARSFLNTRLYVKHTDSFLKLMLAVALLVTLFSFVVSNRFYAMLSILQTPIVIGILYSSFSCLRQRQRQARFIFIAFSLTFISLSLTPFRILGFIPESFITLYNIQIASAIEAVLLSLALADRINILKSDHEQVESALRASETRYRQIFENIQTPYYETKTDGTIIEISPVVEKKSHYKREELIGKSILDFYVDPSERKAVIDKIMKDGELNDEEVKLMDKDGAVRTVSITSKMIKDNQGKIIKFIGSFQDISARKRAEKKLKQAHDELERRVAERTFELNLAKLEAENANNIKSEFLANISHELRNPMHHILSYSKYGLEKFNSAGKDRLLHYFKQIRKSGERLMVLLNDLLDLSKLESGKMEYQFKMNDLRRIAADVMSVIKHTADEKGLSLELMPPPFPTAALCDEYKISQVFTNLLHNAVKYSRKDSLVLIMFEKETLAADNDATPAIKVSIKDEGPGIPEKEFEFIFEKFTQSSFTKTGAGGTGLGLAICVEIINAHQGKIWAENNPEKGATFSFILPIEPDLA